ncbi:hypothetical protein SELMODRAFT_423816 [Selaginella moellendorffii]|uniref:folate gamma-glutamyl hydrolase n=1 Tax=Selaginella moellendorffii TaxID=88036 RepID=D8SMY2_SELML|nr:gamma-glutamyl hydrolase 1 [Selaginella moellendorffii]EFJ14357.1 hypothetical protein SELMODRAFT_423816 [Selaginella moellendorffii]|eukprot:XP_002984712.1 gamma-glutamyl hydrolase 1 [Selaginella moellendorffii]
MAGAIVAIFLALAAIAAARIIQLPEESREKRPLIGILTQPGDGDDRSYINRLEPGDPRRSNISYIAASYVKFVEAGGARAVPLLYNEPWETLAKKFSLINGILFAGGSASLQDGPYYRASEFLFKRALEANDKGDYFPVFGTCLGLELLAVIVSGNHSILDDYNAHKAAGELNFVGDWAKGRSMFTWFPKDILDKVEHEKLAMQNHVKGLSPQTWRDTQSLRDFFDVLTTTPDLNGKIYISTIEGRKYPVTSVQWHPEKNAFEWGYEGIPHSPDAVRITQSAASFFVSEALKSSHTASWEEEEQLLIYNYSPIYSGRDGKGHFDQSYVFW